jgi:hypothetical protein
VLNPKILLPSKTLIDWPDFSAHAHDTIVRFDDALKFIFAVDS